MKITFSIIILLQSLFVFCQNKIPAEKLKNLQIENEVYDFSSNPFTNDEKPEFHDYRENLPKIYLDKDGKFLLNKESEKQKLEINFDKIIYNPKTQKVVITGSISGGWYGLGSDVAIFIGERTDTVSSVKIRPSRETQIYYNGSAVTEEISINGFPTLILKKYVRANSEVGFENHKKRRFKISSKINQKSVLVFGLTGTYVEIFDINKLVSWQ
jgi:hypothetical protein